MVKINIEINSYKIIGEELVIEGDLVSTPDCLKENSKSKEEYDVVFGKDLSSNPNNHFFKVKNVKHILIAGKGFKYFLKNGSNMWSNLKAQIVLINPSMSYEQIEAGNILELVFEE